MTGETLTLLEPAPHDYEGEDYGEWRACRSEQVWNGPRHEVVLRFGAAAFVVACYLLAFWAHLHQPRYVDDYRVLFRDANAGRVVRVDPVRTSEDSHLPDRARLAAMDGGLVRWQTEDGRYEAALPSRYSDVEEAVRAQPYVAAHPDSVTFDQLHETSVPDAWVGMMPLLAVIALIGAPQPRLLTKWGWFWAMALGVGLLPYLIFGGSLRRAIPAPSGRRLNGWVVALTPTVIGMAAVPLFAAGLRDVDRSNLRGVLNPAPVTSGDFREPPTER